MFYKIILYILYIYMLRLEVSVFKLTPRKGEFIFKVLLVFYYYSFFFVIKRNNEYISGTLFVCCSSMVECTCGQIEILI